VGMTDTPDITPDDAELLRSMNDRLLSIERDIDVIRLNTRSIHVMVAGLTALVDRYKPALEKIPKFMRG